MFWNRRRRNHPSEEELSAFLDGELELARRGNVEAHVEACDGCRAALDDLRAVKAMVSRLPRATPSRSFTLSPAMAGARPAAPALRRSSLAFAPVAAFTVLVALFAVDLSSSGGISRDESGAGADRFAAERASEDTSKSQESTTSTYAKDTAPSPATGQALTVPPVAPNTGQAPAPTDPVPSAAAAVPEAAVVPQATVIPPIATGGGAAATQPAERQNVDTGAGTDGDTANVFRDESDDGGTDWLRVAEVLAALAFVVSLGLVFGPGLLKKGR